jgi:Ca-activated chloride channel family protein
MLLRESEHKGASDWALVQDLAKGALGDDPQGYRAQFRSLVGLAQALGDRPKVTALR